MSKEEIDKWLDEEYGCSYTRLEELHDFYFERYCDLRDRINKAIEHNNQIIKDTKSFYRPTEDTIYSGDCLIELAERNIEILKGDNNEC